MRRPLVSLLLSMSLLAFSGAAFAETVRVEDPAGDGLKGRALDITSVKVMNGDHAVVTVVSFVRVARGDLVIFYQARGDRPRDVARVVSRHGIRRDLNTFTTYATGDAQQSCRRLSVTWDDDLDTARVRFPSRCFRGGDYGAIRVRVLTEIGSDADLAPKGPRGQWAWTPWVSRG